MKWARIEGYTVREIIDFDPAGRFHPGLVFVPAAEEVGEGWRWDGKTFVEPEDEPEALPKPDPNAFLLAAMGAIGLDRGNALLAAWPTFTVALGASNWAVARTIIDAATQAGSMTTEERGALLALLDEHGIPEA